MPRSRATPTVDEVPVGPEVAGSGGSVVAQYEPAAVRAPPKIEDGRNVEIVPTHVGMAGIFGNIHAADGAVLDQRLDALAATVCDNDPRTSEQRRADACGPLARGEARWPASAGQTSARRPPSAMPRPQRSSTCWPSRPPLTGPVTRPAICPALAFCPPTVCGRWQSRPRSSRWGCPSRWHRILGIGRGPRRWNSSGGVI